MIVQAHDEELSSQKQSFDEILSKYELEKQQLEGDISVSRTEGEAQVRETLENEMAQKTSDLAGQH